MNTELLYRLGQAQSDDERTWLVTESLLETLSPEMQLAVWAAAIPHWFNSDILLELRPEIAGQAENLCNQLQGLSFIELFPGRGHNIHDLTREAMLSKLWKSNQSEYLKLSIRAANYFSKQIDEYCKIESIYHLVVSERDSADIIVWDYTSNLKSNFQYAELDALLDLLLEHDNSDRLSCSAKAVTYYRKGETLNRTYRYDAALEYYVSSLDLFCEVRSSFGEASVRKSIGDTLIFLNQTKNALESYEQAAVLFHQTGDYSKEADTFSAIGDVLALLGSRKEALESYEQAVVLFQSVDDRLGEANALTAIGDLMYSLGHKDVALVKSQEAISLFEAIDSRLMEASTFTTIGDVLQFLDRIDEALESYAQAIKLAQAVGDRLEEANILKAVGNVLGFLNRRHEALENFMHAIKIFREVGHRLGEANTLILIGDTLHFLDKQQDALTNYRQAIEIFHDLGYRVGKAIALAAVGDVLQSFDCEDEAIAHYEQAIEIFNNEGYTGQESKALMSMGDTLRSLGRIDAAAASYAKAFAISASGGAERPLDDRQAVQDFNRDVQLLLKPNNPHARSLLAFIKRTIHQFGLQAYVTEIDIFVEAYLRGIRYTQQSPEGIRQPKAWMRRTAYNIIREFKRDRLRYSKASFNETMSDDHPISEAPEIPATDDTLSTAINSVLQALDTLSPSDRDLIQWKVVEGLTWNEVQARLVDKGEDRVSQATLRKRGKRALERLRRAYRKASNGESTSPRLPEN
ncbi:MULTISPECIES: tetratricopeptide repeat protein [Cyanophyceae]|uniref:tetratricopeptide repeat protein n=1 Tax=Cyanophyceae TaxID=3028117 RepID=UPI00168904E9|nr:MULTISPECIES: tetratricopeptide repeat protein [Cyanophyceae]MBD1916680.1 tetratricopeptide repeat protein [Phormidium sp. FACHB-77]MBD2031750.1 tetratricopeptide repeat protein [Phormidium sp. FACHB-322]MBD2050500.1 tetratricopeptide repeat protein [Leptolyngbya sp. FACHB-60]